MDRRWHLRHFHGQQIGCEINDGIPLSKSLRRPVFFHPPNERMEDTEVWFSIAARQFDVAHGDLIGV